MNVGTGLYGFTPHLRFTGPMGAAVDYDLSTYNWVESCEPIYRPTQTQHEFVDRSRRSVNYGWQIDVMLTLIVFPGSAEDIALAASIFPKLMDQSQVTEISLDGVTYREASLASWVPSMLDGKKIGRRYAMKFECVQPLSPAVFGALTATAPGQMGAWG